ncbi:MBL fold metallo-hydrolase [Archangium lipolyticum]|uniref:MBL fold metallo-hydrolase n=1 Tax=Archangium lipolyticum TaxID=2970465 RepID=UPI002149B1CD|nr:MBL fold metallo-hydrolase [Archangium lipolyticum]
MRLSGSSVINLRPTLPSLPFEALLRQWMDAAFEPAECRRRLERLMEQKKLSPALFNPEEIEKGGRPATNALLFDSFASPARDWTLFAQVKRGPEVLRAGARLPIASVPWVAQLLRAASYSDDVDTLRAMVASGLPGKLGQVFNACLEPAEDEAEYGAWPVVDAPGIYRREHASLVIRSQTTTLLFDPQIFTLGESTHFSRYPRESGPIEPDAILITHPHEDHWHVPAILRHVANRNIPIIVPVVPRPNLLTPEDFASSLGQVGLDARAVPWGDTVKVGDIEIDVLPFYGEQPTRCAPGPAEGLRCWGNCYRVTCPQFSALILVDSGVDPLGDMVEAVRQSTARRGPVDVVLANCRSFPEGINVGLPQYAMTLPFERLRAMYAENAGGRWLSMTLGGPGVAEACIAAQARYFLPYAHMFRGLGRDAEDDTLAGIRAGLAQRGAATEVLAWNPGDVARFDGARLGLQHVEAPRKAA